MIEQKKNSVKFQSKSGIHLHLLIISMLIQAFGAICTKYAAMSDPVYSLFGIRIEYLLYLIILGSMGLQVITWQYALKYYSLSFAYPFRSLVSFIVLFSAFILFDESITFLNILGLIIISIGVIFLMKDKEILF
jgi:drug/metabolite transporter (DMT)-like permease